MRRCKTCGADKPLVAYYTTKKGTPLGSCRKCCNRKRVEALRKAGPRPQRKCVGCKKNKRIDQYAYTQTGRSRWCRTCHRLAEEKRIASLDHERFRADMKAVREQESERMEKIEQGWRRLRENREAAQQ